MTRTGRRRRVPLWVLVLLFVVLPLVEIYLIVQLGQAVGAWPTILILLADALLGSYLVRREGAKAFRALQQALHAGRMPATELADGALILVAGALLMTPGFLSDVVALFAILPVTRPLARRGLARTIRRRLDLGAPGAGGAGFTPTAGFPGAGGAGRTPRPGTPNGPHVVPGEVVEGDPPDDGPADRD